MVTTLVFTFNSGLELNCLDFWNLPETPVSILKTLSDVRVEEDFPATLECEFSRQIIEVRWFKVTKPPQRLPTRVSVSVRIRPRFKLVRNTCLSSSWTQNGRELKPGKNCRIYSTGRKRFCQILQCSRADSGTYTCDTGEINTCCTLEVYGKSPPGRYRTHLGGVVSPPPTGCFLSDLRHRT